MAGMAETGPTRALRLAGGLLFAVALTWGLVAYLVRFSYVPGPWPGVAGIQAASLNTALFTIFAMHHSVFARLPIKRAISALVPLALERTAYVIVASLLFIAMFELWTPVPGLAWSVSGIIATLMAGVQIGGMLLTVYAVSRLGVMELAGIAPRSTVPSTGLKDTGLYGIVRHPIYLAWLMMVWPAPVMTGSRLVFAIVSTFYLAVAIPFEERTLVRDFGDAYSAYQKKVKWRMVPFVY
jgi:protein-S-isoprenylcysteine O-methyltransferase Ste14